MRLLAFTSAFALVLGCHARPSPDEAIHAASGVLLRDESVAGALAFHEYVVVLLLDPAHVRMCSSVLIDWTQWAREQPDQFILLYTRRPTEVERQQIILHRARGRVAALPETVLSYVDAPVEFLIEKDTVAYWKLGTGPNVKSILLRQLEARTQERDSHNIGPAAHDGRRREGSSMPLQTEKELS